MPKGVMAVQVKPGETLTLELGRFGRDVKGRVAPIPPTTQPSAARQYELIGTLRRVPEAQALATTGGVAVRPPDTRFSFPVAADGSFKLEFLWPGTYELRVMRHEGNGQTMRATSAAITTFTISEKDGTAPLDLGTLKWGPSDAQMIMRRGR